MKQIKEIRCAMRSDSTASVGSELINSYSTSMEIKKRIVNAPQSPGVYIFKNRKRQVLYVGKAANLRNRLKSYTGRGWKEDMLKHATSVNWIELSSDIEALIKEAELIKGYKPRFNFMMKDDKNYAYVSFSNDKFPRITTTHQPSESDKATFIGPFTDGVGLKRVLRLLRRGFPYCTCSAKLKHKRSCVNAQIGKCLGYCCLDKAAAKAELAEYKSNINYIKKVLTGKSKGLARQLEKKMMTVSHQQKYEEAASIRNQLTSINRIFEHSPFLKRDLQAERQKALIVLKELLRLDHVPERIEGYDISHHQGSESVASMVVFADGLPQKSEYRKFKMRTVEGINDPAMMAEVLTRRIRHKEWPKPDLIIVDGGKAQLNASKKKLKSKKIAIASLAKRDEELFITTNKHPFKLKRLPPPLLNLVTHVRDEAHRFAISFHRKRRRILVTKG
jgi:excinuclease ABC subunit C